VIKRIRIKNFKALVDLSLEFTPLTVLVGENSSGKSTVLQALDFLCSITSRDIDEYLKDRDWDFSEIKSQFSSHDDSVCFEADVEIDGTPLHWDISINNDDGKWIVKECISSDDKKECYLSYNRGTEDHPFDFSQINIKSSALKVLDINKTGTKMPRCSRVLFMLKTWLASSSSLELLSPDRMRSKFSRGKTDDIGIGGEKLSAFIHDMAPNKKNELSKLVSDFIGYEVKIATTKKGLSGWVEMFLIETWGETEVKVKKRYISDGLLRIIALTAVIANHDGKKPTHTPQVSENSSPKGLIMLDEIEDGISPAQAEMFIGRFKTIVNDMNRQVVITSHSPVMVNYIDEADIHFMWRDAGGIIHAKPLFDSAEMKETLDILNPGEVWLNYSKDEIIRMLSSPQEVTDD